MGYEYTATGTVRFATPQPLERFRALLDRRFAIAGAAVTEADVQREWWCPPDGVQWTRPGTPWSDGFPHELGDHDPLQLYPDWVTGLWILMPTPDTPWRGGAPSEVASLAINTVGKAPGLLQPLQIFAAFMAGQEVTSDIQLSGEEGKQTSVFYDAAARRFSWLWGPASGNSAADGTAGPPNVPQTAVLR